MWEIQREERPELLDAPASAGEESDGGLWEQDWHSDWESEGADAPAPQLPLLQGCSTPHAKRSLRAKRKAGVFVDTGAPRKAQQQLSRRQAQRQRQRQQEELKRAELACMVSCMCKCCAGRPMLMWVDHEAQKPDLLGWDPAMLAMCPY
jgi:hypothetical protein